MTHPAPTPHSYLFVGGPLHGRILSVFRGSTYHVSESPPALTHPNPEYNTVYVSPIQHIYYKKSMCSFVKELQRWYVFVHQSVPDEKIIEQMLLMALQNGTTGSKEDKQ